MGLDGVELVMAIEEEFKIAISDAEASESDTVGKVVGVVHSRLRHSEDEPCPSQHGFYVVRKHLMDQLGLPRSAVKPESKLDDLVPDDNRRSTWQKLIQSLTGEDNFSAALVRPRWLSGIVMLLVPGIIFAISLKWIPLGFFWLGFIPAAFVAYLGDKATFRWKTRFPSAFSQVKDLIQFVKTLDCGVWSHEQVFGKVRDIAVEILGVKPEQVRLESHWVNDLGMD
jgi:acyl carrier protein